MSNVENKNPMYSIVRPLNEVPSEYNIFMGWRTGEPKEWWCGIEGITYIWMGDWNDPLVGYKGYAFNEFCVEDSYWSEYNEMYPAPDYHDKEANDKYDEGYLEFLRDNKERIFCDLDDLIFAYLEAEEELKKEESQKEAEEEEENEEDYDLEFWGEKLFQ